MEQKLHFPRKLEYLSIKGSNIPIYFQTVSFLFLRNFQLVKHNFSTLSTFYLLYYKSVYSYKWFYHTSWTTPLTKTCFTSILLQKGSILLNLQKLMRWHLNCIERYARKNGDWNEVAHWKVKMECQVSAIVVHMENVERILDFERR